MSVTTLRETLFATTTAEKSGRINVRIIDAGWGSSGYYPAEALEAAAHEKVFPAGTQMFLDHPGVAEGYDRPERTLRDLAAVLTEDAHYDPATKALVAEARVFEAWRKPLTDMADAIGVSIRASAEGDVGTVEGRAGFVISRLVEAYSVDFVTKAGRGGKVLEVFESARATWRAIERGLSEATANDARDALDALVKDAYGADGRWMYVRDFDDQRVWFQADGDDSGTYEQTYETVDGLPAALTGERIQVRATTTYVAVTTTSATTAAESVPSRPAGQTTPQEDPMGTTQIEESELQALREGAGRATVLETARDQAIRERDTARAELAEAHTKADEATIGRIIAEADTAFDTLQRAGLTAQAPRSDDGRLDVDAFARLVTTEAARLAEAQGAGRVRGHGATSGTDTADLSEADLDRELATLSGRTIKEA